MNLRGSRVLLRPVAPDDLPAIEEWWPEAAATVRGQRAPADGGDLRETLHEPGAETLVIARRDDPAPIGLLVHQPGERGRLEFRFLALAQGHRGWGYGSEAVRLVEESGKARRFAARVYRENGLGLYFWLRMGYRPASRDERPWRDTVRGDMVSMIRDETEDR